MKKALFCWSGGKDSAFALREMLTSGKYSIVSLITTVTREYDRISMHGVRRELLEMQSASIGLPLEIVWIEKGSSNDDYDMQMKEVLLKYKTQRVSTVAFGDLFLEDVKKYREDRLASVKMKGLFPLWGRKTSALAHEFIRAGFKSVVTCVDTQKLDSAFCGREYNAVFVADLPKGVDPCGENGEFHSFVFDGPIFKKPVLFRRGEQVTRDERFRFCDLLAV
jgi:uncharacterized protein (TIGR00290 family)